MSNPTQSHSLADFQQNAREHVDRLKQSGQPEVLTVDGLAAVVVQSAQAYQQLREDAEAARALRVIRQGIEDVKAGRVQPAKSFLQELANQHGIQLPK